MQERLKVRKEMNYMSHFKQIRKRNTYFEVLTLFYFLIIHQNLGLSFRASKSGCRSQKQSVLSPFFENFVDSFQNKPGSTKKIFLKDFFTDSETSTTKIIHLRVQ